MTSNVQYWGEFVKFLSTGEIVRLLAYDEPGADVEINGSVVTVSHHEISRLSNDELFQIQCLKVHAKIITKEMTWEDLRTLRHTEFEKLVAAGDVNRKSLKKVWLTYEDLEGAIETARAKMVKFQQKYQLKRI